MDMSGRVVLHRKYNALVHDQRGPVLELEISDEIRPEQDAAKGDTEDRVRVVAVDSHEFAAEPHVLKSKFSKLHIYIARVYYYAYIIIRREFVASPLLARRVPLNFELLTFYLSTTTPSQRNVHNDLPLPRLKLYYYRGLSSGFALR